MNSLLCDLKSLQEIDDQISLGRKILDEGATRLAEARNRLKSFEDKLVLYTGELEAMRARHRELEGEMADLSVKKNNNEARQMSVKNDHEYLALQKEAEYLITRIDGLEDEALALLDRIEKREIEISDLTAVVAEEGETFQHLAKEIEIAAADGRGRQAELEQSRRQLLERLPALNLRQYEELVRTRAGRAVTAAADGLCLACRLGFPPQIYNELQRNEKILNCPNCGRIIFWRDHPDFQTECPSQP